MSDIYEDFISNQCTDRQKKDLGQIVRNSKQSELYRLIESNVRKEINSYLDAINQGTNIKDASATLHLLCGMRKVLTDLDNLESVEKSLKQMEKHNRALKKTQDEMDDSAMGIEMTYTESPSMSLSN